MSSSSLPFSAFPLLCLLEPPLVIFNTKDTTSNSRQHVIAHCSVAPLPDVKNGLGQQYWNLLGALISALGVPQGQNLFCHKVRSSRADAEPGFSAVSLLGGALRWNSVGRRNPSCCISGIASDSPHLPQSLWRKMARQSSPLGPSMISPCVQVILGRWLLELRKLLKVMDSWRLSVLPTVGGKCSLEECLLWISLRPSPHFILLQEWSSPGSG